MKDITFNCNPPCEPLRVLDTGFQLMQKDIKQIQVDVHEIKEFFERHIEQDKEDFGELRKAMKDFIEVADTRYASKRVENVLWSLGGAILLAVLAAILKLVIIS